MVGEVTSFLRLCADEYEKTDTLPKMSPPMFPEPSPLYGVTVVQVPTRPCSMCAGTGTITGKDYSGGAAEVTRTCYHCGGQGRELVVGAIRE